MYFGDKVRALRQENKLTQPELAERLGVEQSWLSKIENNKRLPSSDFLQQVLDTFDLSIHELLEDLDADYVRHQLSVLPEVAKTLNTQTLRQIHSRKGWIITSAISCVLGTVLLLMAYMNLLFPSGMLEYHSDGVIFPGEPLELFTNTEALFRDLGLIDIPDELKSGLANKPRDIYIQRARGEFVQKVLARQVQDSFRSYLDEGEALFRGAVVEEGSSDIYGNIPSSGQRIYIKHEIEAPNFANSGLYIGGFLLLVGGLFGFLVDYRLSKLRA